MDVENAKKLMRRAARASRTLREGSNILAHLDASIDNLLKGVDENVPPVSKVSRELLLHFGADIRQMPVRQFIGMGVKAVLAQHGCEVEDTGVRIYDDPVFSTGATYRRTWVEEDEERLDDGTVLRSMIENLSVRELDRLMQLLKEKRG